tara:strand:+ start:916 stop:1239 length:324 start_codon:yes stop_codon:yes gene_type:complete
MSKASLNRPPKAALASAPSPRKSRRIITETTDLEEEIISKADAVTDKSKKKKKPTEAKVEFATPLTKSERDLLELIAKHEDRSMRSQSRVILIEGMKALAKKHSIHS